MNSAVSNPALNTADLLAQAVDEFLQAADLGTPPDVEQYARRHPEIADLLRDVLPALSMLKPALSGENALRQFGASGAIDSGETLADRTLGDFRILREIGRGGMGVVYQAEQISLSRTVALKVLPFAGVLDEKQLQRFKNEARAAATLEHPHIVPVYSVGCERGVHYFAMRYIEGQSLAEVIAAMCQQETGVGGQESGVSSPIPHSTLPIPNSSSPVHAPSAAETRPELQAAIATDQSTKGAAYYQSVARLGIEAAEALAYAHGQGILHRDVKPANLLLDTEGHLWVADFGLARLEHDAGVTMTGDVLGTLRYMSPEQALGERAVLDERADVYSLGATLYEMLTLRPAFDGQDRQEILRKIANDEPVPPRQSNSKIPRDLETIVLKAMSKEVVGRYATGQQLADDLRRYIEHQPIAARRPTPAEKLVKWSRRHPAVVWATILVLLVTTCISAVSTWLVMNAYHKEAISARNAHDAANAEHKALAAEAEQRKRAEAVTDFIVEAFRSPDPERDGRTVTGVEILNRAVLKLPGQFADDPLAKAEFLEVIGKSYAGLGLRNETIALFEQVLQLRTFALGRSDRETISAMGDLTDLYWRVGRIDDAITLGKETFKESTARFGPDDLATLSAMNYLGNAYLAGGRPKDAIPLYEKAFQQRNKQLGPMDSDTLVSMSNLAEAYLDVDRVDDAISLLIVALTVSKKVSGADSPDTLDKMSNLASAYLRKGETDNAIALFQETLELRKSKQGNEHPETILAMQNVATAYIDVGRLNEAIPQLEEALRLEQLCPALGPLHTETLGTIKNLARAYKTNGQFEKLARLQEELVKLLAKKRGPRHVDTLDVMTGLAGNYIQLDRYADAEAIGRNCLEIREHDFPDSWTTFNERSLLGIALLGQEKYAEAEPLLISGYEGMRERLTTIPAELEIHVPTALKMIVKLYEASDQPEKLNAWKATLATYVREAENQPQVTVADVVDEDLAQKESKLKFAKLVGGVDHPKYLDDLYDLAHAYRDRQKLEEAAALYEEGLQIRTAKLGATHADTLWSLNQFADLLLEQQKAIKAEAVLRKYLSSARSDLKPDDPPLAGILAHLGLALLVQDKVDDAEPLLRESLKIRKQKHPDDWRTFNARSLLGGTLLGQKKYGEAEPLLVSGYEGMHDRDDKIPAQSKKFVRAALSRLIQLYQATSPPDLFTAWQEKLADFDKSVAPSATAGQSKTPQTPRNIDALRMWERLAAPAINGQ